MRLDQVGLQTLISLSPSFHPDRIRIGQVRSLGRQSASRSSDFAQNISAAREQVNLPVASINASRSFFSRLESSKIISPGYTPLVSISIVVPSEFTTLSFIGSFSFVGQTPSQDASQRASKATRDAVAAIAYARTNPEIDAAARLAQIATTTGVIAAEISAQFIIQESNETLASTPSSATISKSSSGTILFRRDFNPGLHVFTLGCTTDAVVGVDAGNASLYIQQMNR